MDNSSPINESASEIGIIKQQLNTYKQINADLSKRIQEFKIELNLFRQENAQLKREIIDEKAKNSKYRRYINTINSQCMDFITKYVANVQEIGQDDMTLIQSTPGLMSTVLDNQQTSDQTTNEHRDETTHQKLPFREQLRSELTADNISENNFLNTIVEESSTPITSTPLSVNINQRHMMPLTCLSNISSSTSTSVDNQIAMETPKLPAIGIARRISLNVRNESETILSENEENEIPVNELADSVESPSELNTTVKSVIETVKECRVVGSPLRSNSSSQNSTSQVDERCLESSNDESATMKTSKGNISIKKRYFELPRRRARPSAESLMEPSLRTKMRRSSGKKK